LAVTVLTNFDSQDLRDNGHSAERPDFGHARALLGPRWAVTGWWPRAKNGDPPSKVGPRFLIVTPGVRPTGKDVDDSCQATTRPGDFGWG